MAVKPKVKPTVTMVEGNDKKKALETAISQIEKQFGKCLFSSIWLRY